MGASDWAARMCIRLEEEFGVSENQALRIKTLVRLLRGEGYENIFGEFGSDRYQSLKKQLIDDLDRLIPLAQQSRQLSDYPVRNLTVSTSNSRESSDTGRTPAPIRHGRASCRRSGSLSR
jgi:hypothetical protein